MGAREELAAIRERAEAALRSDDWADSNREREALSDAVYGSLELVEALEAVLVLRDRLAAAPWDSVTRDSMERSLDAALSALTTDTKGDAR